MKLERRRYIPYSGRRVGGWKRLWLYTSFEVKNMFLKKRSLIIFIFLLILLSFPLLTALSSPMEYYFSGKTKREVSYNILSMYLDFSIVLLFLGLIASAITIAPKLSSDSREGTLAVILSRPITRNDYFLSKFISTNTYIFILIGVPALLSITLFLGALPPTVHVDSGYIILRLLAILLIYTFFLSSIGLFSSSLIKSSSGAGLLTFFLPWITELLGNIIVVSFNLSREYRLISLISGALITASNGFTRNLIGNDLVFWHQALMVSILVPAFLLFISYLIIKSHREV